jgi:replicative DNA helicase
LTGVDWYARIGGGDDKFIVIGGGSGHGKSVLLRQIAQTTLERGQRVLAYTREQSVGDFAVLMASAKLGYDLAHAATQPRDRTVAFGAEVQRMMDHWANKLLWCYSHKEETPLIKIEDFVSHARAWSHLNGPPELVVVDYLQMFSTETRQSNNEARVGVIAYALQALQRELKSVLVVAAQLNESGLAETRAPKHDDNGKLIHILPNRGWVRDSQQIYHAADRMIFIYVPPETADGISQLEPGITKLETWIYQEKRRKGLTGYSKATFEKSFVRFVESGRKQPVGITGTKPEPSIPPVIGKVEKDQYLKDEGPF